jgi:DNA-binding CsgD family transcriptional regulator
MVAFVGRQPELALLRARLTDAVAGRPQIVQIQGPAGIGKTALLDQFLTEIAGVGDGRPAVVIRASGEETEELFAYGVVEQLARSIVHPAAPEPLLDPVTIGARLLEFLDQFEGSPVVLALDDAHWADRPSLQALIFALRRLTADQVLTIIAAREESVADLPDSLRRLVTGQRGTVLRLRGLDEQDLRDLAAAMGIERIGASAARRLRYGTQGNPLHARALLEEFPVASPWGSAQGNSAQGDSAQGNSTQWSSAQWGADDQLLPSPLSFRRLVQERYTTSAPATRRLIDAAAVLGAQCALPPAVALSGVTDPIVALDEAARLDLLRVSEARAPWTLSFPHPLVRAAVYEALGPARRHALHTAAASLTDDESAALRHRVAAAAEPDEALAVDLTRFADREASRQSWQSAAAHLVSASRLSPHPGEAQRRVLQAVVWMMLRGDAATAATYADVVASYAAGPLRDAVLGSLAMAAENPATAEQLLTRAWDSSASSVADDAATPADPETTATVALLTAIHRYGRLDAAATVLWCERALAAIASASISSANSLRAVIMTYLVHGLGYAGRTAESIAAAKSASELPGDDGQLWLNPRSARGLLRLVDDELDAARADLESAASAAARLGILNTSAFSFAYLARAEWVAGLWDDALLHAERAVAINVESDFGFMQSAVIGIAVLVPAARGDWAAAQAYVQTMTEHDIGYERSVVALGLARARIGEARGNPEEVIAALDPVRRFADRDAVDEPGFWAWQDLLADALVATGRIEEADGFLVGHEKLAAARGRRTQIARLARSRGVLEAAAGRTDNAEAAFAVALAATDGLGVPFERARVELAAGRFLRRVGQRRRAADLLTAARQRFTAVGATPYLERCIAELASSGLSPTKRNGRDRAGLTSQELVVARLAAQGLSNRGIADQLVVSIKTIEYHLRNAFGKLGVTSRRQLPDRLAELDD